jgi:hypothetical protein
MPFKSKRQLQTCFGREISAKAKGQSWSWDCKKWLEETDNPGCLPTLKGVPKKCRKLRNGEKVISPIYEGPKGGHFFIAGGVKVYVPPGHAELKMAKKMYGTKK